jgi:hypothetical protein
MMLVSVLFPNVAVTQEFSLERVTLSDDTDVTFVSDWLEYFLVPLLQNPNFNDNETLILLTFDENESYSDRNTV